MSDLDRAVIASKGGGTGSDVLNYLASPAVPADLAKLERRIKDWATEGQTLFQQYGAAKMHAVLAGVSGEVPVFRPTDEILSNG